jgi:hypothetical protein
VFEVRGVSLNARRIEADGTSLTRAPDSRRSAIVCVPDHTLFATLPEEDFANLTDGRERIHSVVARREPEGRGRNFPGVIFDQCGAEVCNLSGT